MSQFITLSHVYSRNWPWNPIELELTQDIYWQSPIKPKNAFESKDGRLTISKDGLFHIKKGFKWNGATDVPDGKYLPISANPPVKSSFGHDKVPETWKATLIHDICYCYLYDTHFPYTRENADFFLKILLNSSGFEFTDLYWWGVRKFGWIFVLFSKVKNKFK